MIVDIDSSYGIVGSDKQYNTWPYGTLQDTVYPGFLAVCRGKQGLGGVLQIVERQCKRMTTVCKDERKGILIITDKWDSETFRKHEKKLLKYAVHDNIWIVILLVTEYGYIQIPFLPNRRDWFKELNVNTI